MSPPFLSAPYSTPSFYGVIRIKLAPLVTNFSSNRLATRSRRAETYAIARWYRTMGAYRAAPENPASA